MLGPFLPLAAKLGRLATGLCEHGLDRIDVTYDGALAEHDTRLVTSAVLMGAFAARSDEPVNLVNARAVAESRGIAVGEEHVRSPGDYTSLVRVACGDGQTVSGTTIGRENRPWLVEVEGYQVEIELAGHMVVMLNDDRPGVIGRVGTAFGEAGVNIANMSVSRNFSGERAVMALALDIAPAQPLARPSAVARGHLPRAVGRPERRLAVPARRCQARLRRVDGVVTPALHLGQVWARIATVTYGIVNRSPAAQVGMLVGQAADPAKRLLALGRRERRDAAGRAGPTRADGRDRTAPGSGTRAARRRRSGDGRSTVRPIPRAHRRRRRGRASARPPRRPGRRADSKAGPRPRPGPVPARSRPAHAARRTSGTPAPRTPRRRSQREAGSARPFRRAHGRPARSARAPPASGRAARRRPRRRPRRPAPASACRCRRPDRPPAARAPSRAPTATAADG